MYLSEKAIIFNFISLLVYVFSCGCDTKLKLEFDIALESALCHILQLKGLTQ
jgi:hypothetical protein